MAPVGWFVFGWRKSIPLGSRYRKGVIQVKERVKNIIE